MNLLLTGLINTFAGGTMSLLNLCHALKNYDDIRIMVFGISTGDSDGVRRIREELKHLGVKLKEEPEFYYGYVNKGIARRVNRVTSILYNVHSVAKCIEENDIDIVHNYDSYANVIGTVAAKLTGRKVVYTAHIETDLLYSFNLFRPKYLLSHADAIVTTCADFIRAGLKAGLDASKMRVIYTGVRKFDDYLEEQELNFADYTLNYNSRPYLISLIGRVDRQKGHDLLIRGIHKYREKFASSIVLLVGDKNVNKEYVQELETLISRLELTSKVKITGTASSIARLLKISSVVVLPSRYESVPMILLEAMEVGTPIVASNVGGIPELVSHDVSGLTFDLEDIDALAKNILRIIENPDLSVKFRDNGRKILDTQFSLREMGARHRELYFSLYSKK